MAFSFGENVFFEWNEGGKTAQMTYNECRLCIENAARTFSEPLSGAPHGAFVGLKLPNSPAWVIAFWALMMAGFRPLLLHMQSSDEETRSLLRDAGAVALVSDAAVAGVVFLDAKGLEKPPILQPSFVPDWADGAALLTSGTGGRPKICVYDGRAFSEQILNSLSVYRQNGTIETYFRGRLTLLAFLPFCHIFGLMANLLWFSFFGCTFVFLKDHAPRTIADACIRHGVTHVFGVPLLFRTVAQSVRREADAAGKLPQLDRALDLSVRIQTAFPRAGAWFVRNVLLRRVRMQVLGPSVRFCITGGGFVSGDTLRTLNALGYALYNGYGTTETGITSVELRLRASDRLSGTAGKPFPSCAYRIGGGAEEGELEVSGGTLYASTLRDGVENPRTEAWHRTGDQARLSGGYLTVLGRMDDLIVTENGEKIAPDAWEDRFSVEHIEKLCIVGIPDGDGHACPTLVVQPEAGLPAYVRQLTLRRLDAVNRSLPQGVRMRRILIADEPLPAVLKNQVRRREVRERLSGGTFAAHAADLSASADTAAEDVLSGVIAIFSDVLGSDAVTPSSHLVYDLGCDSLRYFTLLSRVSDAYRVTLPVSGGEQPMTPAAFAAAIEKQNKVGG